METALNQLNLYKSTTFSCECPKIRSFLRLKAGSVNPSAKLSVDGISNNLFKKFWCIWRWRGVSVSHSQCLRRVSIGNTNRRIYKHTISGALGNRLERLRSATNTKLGSPQQLYCFHSWLFHSKYYPLYGTQTKRPFDMRV